MSSFRVVIEGETLPGFSQEDVRPQLAALVRQTDEAVRRLLSGEPTVVKASVDQATAIRYINALTKIGVACRVEPESLAIELPEPEAAAHDTAILPTNSNVQRPTADVSLPEVVQKGPDEKYCNECRAVIKAKAELCPKCGVRQMAPTVLTPANATSYTQYQQRDEAFIVSDSAPSQLGKATTPKGKVSFKRVWIGVAACAALVLVGQMVGVGRIATPPPQANTSRATAEMRATTDQCFGSGRGMAIVYVANMRTVLNVGLMASDLRDQGCAKTAADFPGKSACLEACNRGFKAGLNEALDALK